MIPRYSPIKRKRSTPRRSLRRVDEGFKALVRTLPCRMAGGLLSGPCEGPVEPDHQGERPYGRKADDDTCVPMCVRHHRLRTDYAGPFKGWDGQRMRAWCDDRIAETRLAVARLREREELPSLW